MAIPDPAAGPASQPYALEAQKICKSFGDLEVLRDVDLTVAPGTTMSILGPSGSGKSTLLRCINWLETPDRGKILLGGAPVGRRPDGKLMSDRELAKVRARMGMVFQSFNLWPHFTVLQNVIEAPTQVLGMARDAATARAEELLEKVGLADKRDVYSYSLSGGQKQRVAIARALCMSPEVLLFDEPTSALDPELVGEVLTVIRDLAAEGRTMILVTHEMKFAREVATHVIYLSEGRIEEEGPPEEVFGNPKSERLQQFLRTVA